MNEKQDLKQVALGPLALLGLLWEIPVIWVHRRLKTRRRLATWYCILALSIGAPVKGDFLGFDLVPLAGSLLADIRSFYLEYQDQIMAIKKMAVAYYTIRQLDVGRLKDELGELAELETAEVARNWLNTRVTGYVDGLTRSGQDHGSSVGPAYHSGALESGMRFRIEDPNGDVRFLTNTEIFNELFNPFDPNWDPSITNETYMVLMARERWFRRELNSYQRAIYAWEKLSSLYNNLYLDDLETATVAQAIKWAVSASPEVDKTAAYLQSMDSGPLAQFIKNRLNYWKTRLNEVRIEQTMVREALSDMKEGMAFMERRALGKVAATMQVKNQQKWQYDLTALGSQVRLEPVSPQHWSLFPKGWH